MLNKLKIRNIFAAVSDKSVLDPLLEILDKKSVKFWGTEGTVRYLKSKGFSAFSAVAGFDFDGRVKSLDRITFARILTDRTKKRHLGELESLIYSSSEVESDSTSREVSLRSSSPQAPHQMVTGQGRTIKSAGWEPFDLVIVDLYPLDPNNFPESMDIGGQALIRAAIKNYKGVAVAFDKSSLASLVRELISNKGSSTLNFRKTQTQKAAKFIAERTKEESKLF